MSFRRFALVSSLVFVSVGMSAQQTTLPLWPHNTPEPPQTTAPESDSGRPVTTFPADHRAASLSDVTEPTLSVYPPPHRDRGNAAALVFPGGGYQHLAWTKEGLDACDWLNSLGMTCLLVKYRIPEPHFPESYADLEDAQQAMRLARAHAAEWHLNPAQIGVIGFSAGGNLAALLSTHFADTHIASTPAAADSNPAIDARPNFAILVYPAYLALSPEQTALDPVYQPGPTTPPTFLTAAENDRSYGRNALVYYRSLLDASVPAELHFFPTGGHGFGVYPKGSPAIWIDLAANWLRQQGILATAASARDTGPASPGPTPANPCPTPTPPTAGRPTSPPNPNPDPNCPTP